MKEIIQKLSSYNIFNYLFPGFVFAALTTKLTSYNLVIDNLIVGAFLYYFVGLIISRIGSLIIEPILKKCSIISFSDYKKFISASKKDENITLFSEVNNMYRTLISLLFILLTLIIYEQFAKYITLEQNVKIIILVSSLIILFIFSYRKQSQYINKRIEAQDSDE